MLSNILKLLSGAKSVNKNNNALLPNNKTRKKQTHHSTVIIIIIITIIRAAACLAQFRLLIQFFINIIHMHNLILTKTDAFQTTL